MDRAINKHEQYLNTLLRVQLSDDDFAQLTKQRRFEIRAPPSQNQKSTAECLAWVVSRVEQQGDDNGNNGGTNNIYETVMKPLDLMVRSGARLLIVKKKPKSRTKRGRLHLQQNSDDASTKIGTYEQ